MVAAGEAPLRVLIDGFNLGLETGTGVATYARNLSYAVHDLGHEVDVLYGTRSAPFNRLLREIAFFDPAVGAQERWYRYLLRLQATFNSSNTLLAREVPITGRVIAKTYQARLPYYDRLWNIPGFFERAERNMGWLRWRLKARVLSQPQIAHWTYPLPVRLVGAKNIYTLHDLVPLRLPYTTLDVKRNYFRLARRLAKHADHIVTVSEQSRRDIIDLLEVPEHRVTNTYQAVRIPAKFADKPEAVVRREVEGTFGLKYKNYFMFFGAIEPKKNVGRMIEAYLGSTVETPLLIVGKLAWKAEEELRLLNDPVNRRLEMVGNLTLTRQRVQRVDYAPFGVLVSLIRGAKAVLFPSLYEGFGLPALEAMLLGTPVMTSTEGSMPEIAGADSALLVDPYDARAMAEAIRALDTDEALRARLSEKGRERAAFFSHEAYQARLAELYDRVL